MKIHRITGIVALLLITLTGCTFVEVNLLPQQVPLKEVTLMGKGKNKVVLVDVSGFLSASRSPTALGIVSRPSIVEKTKRVLNKAAKDHNVKGLILRINSPGGTVTASDILFHLISTEAAEHHWNTVACLMELATSGGYYTALSAQEIWAHPTTVTGAVGVIALKLDLEGLLRKVGVQVEVYKSGAEKDAWSPFRPSSPEERKHIQSLIQDFSSIFFNLVEERRKLSHTSMAQVKTGRILSAREAKELGLVDEVGYLEDAFDRVKTLAGIKEAKLVAYMPEGTAQANIYSDRPTASSGLLDLLSSGQAAYLWIP
jgi:protease-4